MILHLVNDEKVVHRTIQMFEEYNPGENLFVCFSSGDNYKHLHKEDNVLKYNGLEVRKMDFSIVTMVIIHYLNNEKIRFIYKHQLQDKAIFWIVWGSDLYNFLYKRNRFELYSEENTYPKLKLQYKGNAIYNLCKDIKPLAIFFSKYATKIYSCYTDHYRNHFFVNHLNYTTSSGRSLEYIKNGHKLKCYKGHLDFCYYPIEETLRDLTGKWCSGNNIMIGNSAQATNNHEYILKFVKSIDTSKYSLTIPLNYAGDEEYVDIVNQKYSQLPNARVLLDFMPLDEYNKLLLSSKVCIYGHFRGEAWGNILISLYLGAKVYISKHSPILVNKCYPLGFKVFELEGIADTFKIEITQEERERNRNIALTNFSKEMCGKYIERIKNISEC